MSQRTIHLPEAGTTSAGLAADQTLPPEVRLVRPIADPAPLGLAAFALTTFTLSLFNAGWVGNAKLEAVVLPLALAYGGIAQLLAGMWEFRNDNTFGAVAFTSYGAFWLSFAAYVKFIVPGLPTADAHTATGIFLLSWTIFTAYMLIASLRTSMGIITVFALLTATFALLMAGAFGQRTTVTHIGGYLGVATAIVAWYVSMAAVTNATWGRTVFPVFPIGALEPKVKAPKH